MARSGQGPVKHSAGFTYCGNAVNDGELEE
jgi:hypothetical protein